MRPGFSSCFSCTGWSLNHIGQGFRLALAPWQVWLSTLAPHNQVGVNHIFQGSIRPARGKEASSLRQVRLPKGLPRCGASPLPALAATRMMMRVSRTIPHQGLCRSALRGLHYGGPQACPIHLHLGTHGSWALIKVTARNTRTCIQR